MGKFNSKSVTPKLGNGGVLPEGEYTITLMDVGSWNTSTESFETGLIKSTSNKNPQFTLNWQISDGNSHVGLFLRDHWQVTEATFPYILGKLGVMTSGNIPEIDANTQAQAAKELVKILIDLFGVEIKVWAGTVINEKTKFKSNVIKQYLKS